ncbi:hypothetical protein GCM10023189_34230 [Nibrella saemangeumensis]|uniref:SnoaL-like domain-containing protein n=1 Tax=Nibrella saemangeumensis TaxID=1084526 RepID=A0ABP8N4W5_9BACT
MTTQESRQFIEEYIDAMRNTPTKTDEFVDRFISDKDMELKGHIQIFEAGVPGYILDPEDIIVEGNKVVVRFRMKGQHKGELFGYPPSGNQLDVSGIIIYELEDNKIVRH